MKSSDQLTWPEVIALLEEVSETDKRLLERVEAGETIPEIDRIRALEQSVSALTACMAFVLNRVSA